MPHAFRALQLSRIVCGVAGALLSPCRGASCCDRSCPNTLGRSSIRLRLQF